MGWFGRLSNHGLQILYFNWGEGFLVEIREGGNSLVSDDRQDVEIVLIHHIGKLLGYIDAIDVVCNQLRDVIAHSTVLDYRDDTGEQENNGYRT